MLIGQSRRDPSERYIKHIRPRSSELIHDGSHVVGLKLTRTGGFLGFSFTGYAAEHYHLADNIEGARLARAAEIHQLAHDGLTQRQIAIKLGISLGSVNRYLQMEVPEPPREITHHPAYVKPLFEEPVDFSSLTDEERRAEYLKHARTASDNDRALVRTGSDNDQVSDAVAKVSSTASNPRADDPHLAQFEHRIDHMGDDIWIEEERFGKPWIYYKVNKNNVKFRYERTTTSTIFATLIEEDPP